MRFWFRYIERNRPLIELGNYEGLSRLINDDYPTYSGKTLELYFKQKMQESFEYGAIGSWWEPKGSQNEIGIVAITLDNKKALIAEVRRQKKNFRQQLLEAKIDVLKTKVLNKYAIDWVCLDITDMIMQDIVNGRCGWCGTDGLYVKYHDEEWGKLVTDDKRLFEFLVLESAQAGLSWITILRKREGYRKAFCDFDAGRVAQMGDEDVERLMQFDGIVRNRLKIKSTITNAILFLAIQKEFGNFYDYTLSFFPDRKPIINAVRSMSEIPSSSLQSDAMSKDMKKRGFKFFGTTICYAHLQAAGFINDHLTDCICRK